MLGYEPLQAGPEAAGFILGNADQGSVRRLRARLREGGRRVTGGRIEPGELCGVGVGRRRQGRRPVACSPRHPTRHAVGRLLLIVDCFKRVVEEEWQF